MEKVVVQTGAKTYQITDQDGNDLGVFRCLRIFFLRDYLMILKMITN